MHSAIGLGTSAATATHPTLIQNVTIVDVEQGKILPECDVFIRSERIERIARSGRVDPSEGTTIIDAEGLYLMPGLIDAHVHITAGEGVFEPLLIAHGVTAARDTGAQTEAIVQRRESAATGSSLSPELIVTGAIVDGDPPVWPFSEVCDTPEQSRAAVTRLADAGVDQIKVYSMLKPDVYAAAVEAAGARGLKVTGHIPRGMSLQAAIEAGQHCIEHFEGFAPLLRELAPEKDAGPRQRDGLFATYAGWLRYDDVDRDALHEVLRELAEAEVMQCPTLAVWRGIMSTLDEDAASDDRMKYVPPTLRAFWDQPRYQAFAQVVDQTMPAKLRLLHEMYEAGVPLMIGSDLGNPYVFPGWSVHEEMVSFQEAGIPTAAVLRMATIEPAIFTETDERLGSIAPGKTASMILVRKNPLKDVRHAREIEAVFLRGRYFDRAALDELFDQAAAAASDPSPAPERDLAMQLPGEVMHRGTFTMKFQQWDAGSENFLLTRDHETWHAAGHVRPTGGGQQPSLTTITLDHNGAFRRATWTQLTEPPIHAEYTVKNGQLHIEARRGDDEPNHMMMDLPDPFLISAPALVADMLLLPTLNLQPGDRREFTMVGLGFMSWRPQTYPAVVERRQDAELVVGDGEEQQTITTHVYHMTMDIEMVGEMQSELHIDANGLLRRSALRMAYGEVSAEYRAE